MIEAIGLEKTIKHLREYRNKLETKRIEFIGRLAEIGIETARTGFAEASYSGTNDVEVGDVIWESKNKAYIVASGSKVLFIEFGSGTFFRDYPGKLPSGVSPRGTYGKGLGEKPPWEYAGEMGDIPPFGTEPATNSKGEPQYTSSGEPLIKTLGNPPARAMYDAGRRMRLELERIAKEVFHD